MRRPLVWMLGAMAVLGCTRPATSQTPEPAATERPRRAAPDPALVAVADAVDPGPQPPLLSALPEPLRKLLESRLGATAEREVATREIREALTQWDKLGTSLEGMPERLLALGRGLVLAERAVAAGDSDAELLLALSRTYAILDSPFFSTQQGMFSQLLGVAAQVAQAGGVKPGELDFAGLVPVLKDMFVRAGPLHRHTAAALLRAHGDHPDVPKVLDRLADDALRREDYPHALAWRRLRLERLGAKATESDRLELARTCYRALELACGDEALARGRAFTGDTKATAAHDKRVAWTVKTGEQARRVTALAGEAGLDASLERGYLLVLLERGADAQALFDALRAEHPGDARPYGGLAKLAVQRGGDFKGAAQQVERGKALANKDREFYEVALGTLGVNFLYEALPEIAAGNKDVGELAGQKLADMRALAEGYRGFDPPRAAVVELIVGAVQAMLPGVMRGEAASALKLLRTLPARVEPLMRKFPDSPDLRRMVELAANFHTDEKTALQWVSAPLSPALAKDAVMQGSRARVWLDQALMWERADQLPALAEAIAALPVIEGDRLRSTLLAAMASLKYNATGDQSMGESAVKLYEELERSGTEEQRAAALNNLGVLKVALGDVQGGVERINAAAALGDGYKAALLNVAAVVMQAEGAQRPELSDVFERVSREGETAALRVQAAAWQYAQAQRGAGDVEQTRADFVARLASERKEESRGALPLGRWGIIGRGSAQVSFYYSTTQGFEIRNELTSTLWLVFPAPTLDELMQAAPAKKADKKAKAK